MNILITGGAGFIGSHLSKALLLAGHTVSIVDNFHEYYSVEKKRKHIELIQTIGDFQLYEIDLLDKDRSEIIFKENRFDSVIHLAALPGVAYSIEAPLSYVDYDIKATINLLELVGKYQIDQFIFASSSSVYGNQSNKPIHERMANGKVVSPYAASKYGAESFCHAYQSLFGFNLTILRFFTVYGPWGRPDMAIPIFINRLMNKKPIQIFGKEMARDFTYIDDIVSGITKALQCKKNDIFNLGYGNPVPMEHLLRVFKQYFEEMKVEYIHERQGDVKQTWADISKASRILDYKPKVSIEEGLKRTIEWWKSTTE